MPNTHHAFDFLNTVPPLAPVCVLFGDEPFLKRLARKQIRERADDAVDDAMFDGTVIDWKDIADELATVSLFGSGSPRRVFIEKADRFVTKHRERLESYAEKPKRTGILVLEVDTWQKNTRLYKLLDKVGLQIECRVPEKGAGSRKSPDEPRLRKWLVDWARATHGVRLEPTAAEAMLALVGPHLGLLDQELAKLALFSDDQHPVTPALVTEIVGGWRTESIWELVETAAQGQTADALQQLDRLLQSGEQPVALFGQISWSLRRFATATRIYESAERQRRSAKLGDALVKAGFPHWDRRALGRAEHQLKQLGRRRAGQLFGWLLDTDLALKGSHSAPERARFALESLIVRLGGK